MCRTTWHYRIIKQWRTFEWVGVDCSCIICWHIIIFIYLAFVASANKKKHTRKHTDWKEAFDAYFLFGICRHIVCATKFMLMIWHLNTNLIPMNMFDVVIISFYWWHFRYCSRQLRHHREFTIQMYLCVLFFIKWARMLLIISYSWSRSYYETPSPNGKMSFPNE